MDGLPSYRASFKQLPWLFDGDLDSSCCRPCQLLFPHQPLLSGSLHMYVCPLIERWQFWDCTQGGDAATTTLTKFPWEMRRAPSLRLSLSTPSWSPFFHLPNLWKLQKMNINPRNYFSWTSPRRNLSEVWITVIGAHEPRLQMFHV